MGVKTYRFLCEHCGYKRITSGNDIHDLREIETSAVPRGAPKLNQLAKKNVAADLHQPAQVTTGIHAQRPLKQKKKFKCPQCGYVIMARQIQLEEYAPNEQTNRLDGGETGASGPSLPGELAQ